MKKEEIEHLSELARIELSPKEKSVLEKDLDSILNYINQIKSVSEFIDATTDTATGDVRNVSEEDTVQNDFSTEKLIELFPKAKNDHLIVKKVL